MGMSRSPGGNGCLAESDLHPLSHDESAKLEELFQDHYSYFFRHFQRKMRSVQHAEDMAAELFSRAAGQLAQFGVRGCESRPWLMGIARHMICDWYRRGEGARDDVSLEQLAQQEEMGKAVQSSGNMQSGVHIGFLHDDVARRAIWMQLQPRLQRAYFFRYVLGLSSADLQRIGCEWSPAYYRRLISMVNAHLRRIRREACNDATGE
jgi:DNA-directed RNA polymerase specialized sigma24 family protein